MTKDSLLRLADEYAYAQADQELDQTTQRLNAKLNARFALSAAIDSFASQVRKEAIEGCLDWSWIRSVLSQGTSIQQDYMAGKYPTYEHYSARLDAASLERFEEVASLRALAPAGKGST